MTLPEWDETAAVLGGIDAPTEPAECHGVLCGLLCAPAAEPASRWVQDALGFGPERVPPAPLDALFRETLRQLDDESFRFELMLPPDEADLGARTMALGQWAAGFAYGIGASGVAESALSADAVEFLGDVEQIARAETGADESAEADEEAYAEIVEYLRMGVLLMRTGQRPHAPAGG